MENKRTLFERYLKREISAEELQYLLSLFDSEGYEDGELDDRIDQLLADTVTDGEEPGYLSSMLDRNKLKLDIRLRKLDVMPTKRNSIRRRVWQVAVAATVLLSVFAGTAYLKWGQIQDEQTTHSLVDIAPGTDRALLILDSGKEFVLDGKALGIVNGDDAIRYADGTLLTAIDKSEEVVLRTPKGGQFRATLPDGTRVWLNAGSEIRYPSVFDVKERTLMINGEVYLEVAKESRRPFVVVCEEQKVEVLGTHFNVNAYRDNGDVMTTLSEGSVRVIQSKTGATVLLKPGQRAKVSPQGKMTVKDVDLAEALSWKDGLYIINDQELGLFAKQIERWYDVDVDMALFGTKKLSAVVPRSATLSAVLDAITLKTDVQFKIEGRRVTAVKR